MDITTFIRRMPKAELHVHLESTMEPALRLELARRNGVDLPYSTAEEIAATYVYPDIMMWFDIRYEADKVLKTEQDFYDLTYAFLLKQKSQNVVYTEIQYDPQMHMERGLDFGTVISGIHGAQVDAQDHLGVRSQLIWTITREKSAEDAMATLEASLQFKDWLVGIGLASIEEGNPPEKFREVFRRAHSEGFRITSHCDPGVEGVVDHIRQCLDLQMDRIDHGQNCLDDDSLTQEIKRSGLCLTPCPLVWEGKATPRPLSASRIRALIDLGIKVAPGSDGGAYFSGRYMNEILVGLQEAIDLTEEELVQLMRNAFEGAWISQEERTGYLAQLESYAAEAAEMD